MGEGCSAQREVTVQKLIVQNEATVFSEWREVCVAAQKGDLGSAMRSEQ